MNTKLIAVTLVCAVGGTYIFAANEPVTSALHAELDRIEASCAKVAAEIEAPLSKKAVGGPAFCFKGANDLDITLNGSTRVDYNRSWNTETLNSQELDRIRSYNGKFELGTVITYGKEQYGKPAVELAATMRQQYQAGRFDKVLATNASTVKIADAVFAVPGSSVNATVPWIKSVYAKILLNALVNGQAGSEHYMKLGLFEYSLGRGIAYGSSYGTPKKYLGIYNSSNNFAPFGVLLSGDLVKNRLEYELYFARMEEKSSSFKDVNARTKTHIVGNKRSGAGGIEISNDVFAGALKGHYDSPRLGDLKTTYFAMYNRALDQQIEMPNDCESQLVTVGAGFEYEKGNFEFGGEVAFNMGAEYVYNIDRNTITLAGMYPGQEDKLTRTYTNVVVTSGTDTVRSGAKAPVVSSFKSAVDGYAGNENNASIATNLVSSSLANNANDYVVANSAARFRPAYKNDYAGWMGVLDAAYNWKAANLKLSVAAGHASGDANPHDRELNKSYHGFLGINENYAGKRVKSVIALGARKLQAPLTADPNAKQLFDNSFTDLTFVGSGIVWRVAKRNIEVGSNALAFFKDSRSRAYVYDSVNNTGGFGSKFARRYMGVELNLTLDWQLLQGLNLIAEGAVFLPGAFYKDVKGLPLDGSVIKVLDEVDSTGYVQSVPRLGTDPQVSASVALQYKF